MLETVGRLVDGHDAAAVSHVAATVDSGVAVENLPKPAALGNPDGVARPRHRREVGQDDAEILRVARLADHRDDAVLVVVAVDPAEPRALEVDLVQRRLALIG